MEALASTSEYLQFNALHNPGTVALIDRGREFTCAQFHRDLGKFSSHVRGFGLPAGSAVAVGCDDLYVHWLLLLAFEDLGVVTGSFRRGEGAACMPLFRYVDLVVSDHDVEVPDGKRVHRLTEAWVDAVMLSSGDPDDTRDRRRVPRDLDQPLRITRSSGTTGGLKMMLKTRQAYEARIQHSLVLDERFIRGARHLFLTPFTIQSIYARATACLRTGATAIFDESLPPARAIARYAPTHAHMLPIKLAEIVRDLPADFEKPQELVLRVGGGPLTDALRQSALKNIASAVIYHYGSNEVDSIALIDETGIATVVPGVDMEIVDDHHQTVAPGGIGRIRVRSPGAVERYLDNPEATAAMFHDGWHYTGDVGSMEEPRRLRIVGRYDELLNIGGLKVAPAEIEGLLARGGLTHRFSIAEFAVTSVQNDAGIEQVCVAVVAGEPVDLDEVTAAIANSLPRPFNDVRVKFVDALPRTEGGKIRQSALRQAFL